LAGSNTASVEGETMKTRDLVLAGLLTAISLLIPLVFRGWLQIAVPAIGFSATLASHVPTMLAMAIGPWVAVAAGLGSAFGFLITLGPIVASRAFTHAVWGLIGALAVRGGWPLLWALGLTLPIHALGEGAVVWVATNSLQAGAVVTGTTMLHHTLDGAITLSVFAALRRVLPGLGAPAPAHH
jgi:niacin transporter